MEKKISIKKLFLLFVISIGLIGLGIASTYAVFITSVEINNPIVLSSALSYESEIIDTVTIEVPAGEIVSSELNITNSNDSTLNYAVWYDNSSYVVEGGTSSGSPAGSLASGSSVTVVAQIRNNSSEDITVTLGVSSSASDIILNNNMKILSNSPFTAYAVYSVDDSSLTFYKTLDTITVGSTYKGKTVTAVYAGVETETYLSNTDIPWYGYRNSITNVDIEDVISPVSTRYWFYYFENCTTMNLTKLDTSNITTMYYMFYRAGYNITSFELIGLENWDTSSVDNMEYMFSYAGQNATIWTIGDLSKWNTSSVTNMNSMFYNAGTNAAYTLDLSTKIVTRDDGTTYKAWDVSKVTNHSNFDAGVTSKIVDPSWVS